VLTIDADNLDFVRNEKDLAFIKKKIDEAAAKEPLQPDLI
jgi:deoxyadenosine/deoxycytidine kinase